MTGGPRPPAAEAEVPSHASHDGDLALVAAFGAGDGAALTELDRRFRGELAGALSRVGLTRSEIDEVGQIVRERLFVAAPGRPPRVLDYGGRGTLVAWFRAVIVRAGIDLRRSRAAAPDAPGHDDEPLLALGAASDDPEIESLRSRYGDAFRLALADAVRALPADERNALRLHVAEGLSGEQIAALYGVHRATAARWIVRAREGIADQTRQLLQARLGLPASELESLVRLCQSRLDIGVSILEDP